MAASRSAISARHRGQYHGAGCFTGLGLRFRHLAQRYRLPFTAVLGRSLLPVRGMLFMSVASGSRIHIQPSHQHHSRRKKTDSVFSDSNCSISSSRERRRFAICRVDAFPRQTWTTCGGWPRTKARARESLSFVTMINPSAFARDQMRSSSSPVKPTSRTWQLPGKRVCRTETSRNERFWSSRAFTRPTQEVVAPALPRRPSTPEYLQWSTRGNQPGSQLLSFQRPDNQALRIP
jgi:hypothetical protein